MNKIISGIFIASIFVIGAWMKFSIPDADNYDPFSNPTASVEIVKDTVNLVSNKVGDKEITSKPEKDNVDTPENAIAVPINDQFKKELVSFYSSKSFSQRYSGFVRSLVEQGEIVFYPTTRSYINKLVAKDIDGNNFSITVYLTYEDSARL